jgi:hypothetical chaperone protein
MSPITLGLDFGTTNTVVSSRHGGDVTTLAFKTKQGLLDTVRTVLALWQDPSKTRPSIAVGRDALAEFSEFPEDTRLLQSLKSYAANPLFRQAMILNSPYTFSLLMQTFLEQLFRLSDIELSKVGKIIVGRPVKFAGYAPDENLALSRYTQVFNALGIRQIEFVYEPVAAALAFARRLTKPATVLIADFGGGTTDFSVLKLSPTSHEVLGVGGIGLAGDQFDYRIVVNAILPHLGMGSHYRSMGGKKLELPKHVFHAMGRWNELSFLRLSKDYTDLQDLSAHADAPDKLRQFFDIVDHSKGLDLYDAVSRVKRQLSMADEATLQFENLKVPITRLEFEAWIADDLERIDAALGNTMDKIGIAASEIDSVFLTGGTSLVPAVRKIFSDRFGESKLHAGEELISVAKGLAHI